MHNDFRIYRANLDSQLLKSRKGGLLLVLLIVAALALIIILSVVLFTLIDMAGGNLGAALWSVVILLGVFALYVLLRQQSTRKMSRSAIIVEGHTVTLLTLSLENENNTFEALIGSAGVNMKNGFNTEDLLGFGLGNGGRKKGGSAYRAAVIQMQDEAFIADKYRTGYGKINLTRRYNCKVVSIDNKELVITGSKTPNGPSVSWRLPNVFGQVTIP